MSRNNPYHLKKSDLESVDYFEQTDTPDGLMRQKIEDYNNNELYNFEMPVPETTGETTNRWDLGRNCPYCAGRLVEHAMSEDGYLQLRCTSCQRRVYADDINHRSETVDALYRSISDRSFQKWLDFKDKRIK